MRQPKGVDLSRPSPFFEYSKPQMHDYLFKRRPWLHGFKPLQKTISQSPFILLGVSQFRKTPLHFHKSDCFNLLLLFKSQHRMDRT